MLEKNHSKIALVGSPNSGKTSLFNVLTGSRHKTANYPGVTVEKKTGNLNLADGLNIEILDLPGTYSLSSPQSPDEKITSDVILGKYTDESAPDAVIAVADLTSLTTNLYLVLELIETGVPVVLALTMSDLAKKHKVQFDLNKLEANLNIPIVVVSSLKKHGIENLKKITKEHLIHIENKKPVVLAEAKSDRILTRYKKIDEILKTCTYSKDIKNAFSKKIDAVVLHKFFGPVLLLLVLALMFQAIFTLAEAPKGWIDSLVAISQDYAKVWIPEGPMQSLLVDGILAGVGSVIIFLPQILILFAFILFFEDSGYMARAAFIMDKLMGKVGLHGRAFIPLLSSFACAVPGIMATRTIENPKDRLATILIAPLMTCSARLPVYALLIAAFIPNIMVFGFLSLQGLVMLALYIAGVLAALAAALIFKKSFLKQNSSSFVIELPSYKMPVLNNIFLGLWERALVFLKRAGTIILAISIILWFLSSYPKMQAPESFSENQAAAYQLENSYAGRAGKFIEPVIKPLGYDWKIGVGILASLAAREVVVSTLATVYAVGAGDEDAQQEELSSKLASDPALNIATALSLLVFYVLACQCISTLAVVRRETNSYKWPAFMFAYMTIAAYLFALLTYRIAPFRK